MPVPGDFAKIHRLFQNRDVAVVVSSADYQWLTRSNIEEFQCFCDRISKAAEACGMTEETLDKVLGD